jgi:hypothetical protein
MLIAAACFVSPGGRQENCVWVSPDRARFPVRRRPSTVQTQPADHPGTVAVAKAVGWRVACFSGGRVGWPYGKCRLIDGLQKLASKNQQQFVYIDELGFSAARTVSPQNLKAWNSYISG